MKMFSKDGIEMMDVKSISKEGETIVLKGKMMGAMTAAVCVRPEDAWQAFRLMPWPVIFSLPLLLAKGFWRSRG